MLYKKIYKSPLGNIFLISDGINLVGLYFNDQKFLDQNLISRSESKELEIFDNTSTWLDIYFSGKDPNFTPKISLQGSDYRQKIWDLLSQIPYGNLTSYKNIANRYNKLNPNKKTSPRAVGSAVSHNPVSIIIPCHRVIGSSGNLTGYAGGIDRKIKLLELENINLDKIFYKK